MNDDLPHVHLVGHFDTLWGDLTVAKVTHRGMTGWVFGMANHNQDFAGILSHAEALRHAQSIHNWEAYAFIRENE